MFTNQIFKRTDMFFASFTDSLSLSLITFYFRLYTMTLNVPDYSQSISKHVSN